MIRPSSRKFYDLYDLWWGFGIFRKRLWAQARMAEMGSTMLRACSSMFMFVGGWDERYKSERELTWQTWRSTLLTASISYFFGQDSSDEYCVDLFRIVPYYMTFFIRRI